MDRQPTPIPADRPLGEVVDDHEDVGFDGQFKAEPGAQIRCLTCNVAGPATAHRADLVTRLEGASDPADMAIVVPLVCPSCGTKGTLIANYGPEASADEADVLVALDRSTPGRTHS